VVGGRRTGRKKGGRKKGDRNGGDEEVVVEGVEEKGATFCWWEAFFWG
jgi:hypothetical protein